MVAMARIVRGAIISDSRGRAMGDNLARRAPVAPPEAGHGRANERVAVSIPAIIGAIVVIIVALKVLGLH